MTNPESEIRDLLSERTEATRNKDIGSLMESFAPEVLSFDVIDPLQYKGSNAINERMEQWFSTFEGSIGFEVNDLQITANDDIGFCSGLNHVHGTKIDGDVLDMWWRSTLCLKKINGKWQIMHQHNSVPFNTETGKASLDLKP